MTLNPINLKLQDASAGEDALDPAGADLGFIGVVSVILGLYRITEQKMEATI